MLKNVMVTMLLVSLAGLTACNRANDQPMGQSQVRQTPDNPSMMNSPMSTTNDDRATNGTTGGTYGGGLPNDGMTGTGGTTTGGGSTGTGGGGQ